VPAIRCPFGDWKARGSDHDVRRGLTERDDIELLLSQPEIIAWLELSEPEIIAWLEQLKHMDADDESARAA
jgi:hypothetical protein